MYETRHLLMLMKLCPPAKPAIEALGRGHPLADVQHESLSALAVEARMDLEAANVNSQAVVRFALRVRRQLLCYFRNHGWGLPDAEQSAVDALAHVVAKLNRFDPAKGTCEAWVQTIARNRLHDELRALPRDDEESQVSGLCTGTSALVRLTALEKSRLLEVFDEFTERERDLLRLIFLQGMNAAEASAEMDITHENARMLKRRLLKRLNEVLG